jgi:predicted TIM-barrel fold metal-dependent hydrolase
MLQESERRRIHLSAVTAAPCLPPRPVARAVSFEVPAGAWDAHIHALGAVERFPLAQDRSYTPAVVPIDSYVALMDEVGLAHAVLVQPSVYGTDNRALLDALARHPSRFRGVAVVAGNATDRELAALHAAGVRGIRANLLNRGGISLDDAHALAQRFAAFGWHLQLQVDVSTFDRFDDVASFLVDVVVDHLGYMPAEKGPDEPGFRRLLRLVESGRCWVKLSAAYRLTSWRARGYGAVAPLARALIAANPSRMLWGSDWPHTDLREDMPDDGELLDLLATWATDEGVRNDILVRNPATLYGR